MGPEGTRGLEVWIAWVRLGAAAFAFLEIGVFSTGFPPGYQRDAWITAVVFAAGAVAIAVASRAVPDRALTALGMGALVFDAVIIGVFATIFSFEYGSPTRWGLVFVVIEGAIRYALLGGILVPLALVPFFVFVEHWRSSRFGPPGFDDDRVSFPAGVLLLVGVTVGWLVGRLREETVTAGTRAEEAEALRDELGRRVDAIDALNRCARALGSSLVLEDAFAAFIRELRGLVPFDRAAIVLAEGGQVRMMAVSGLGGGDVLPAGTSHPIAGTLLEEVLGTVQTAYRAEMTAGRYVEEKWLVELGLSARVLAPLLAGARPIGGLALLRSEPGSFTREDVELAGVLGRLVGTAVQNIRAYESERRTVEELKRLSSLRADFVSLVSHELRGPVGAMSGVAQTLRARWDELTQEDRDEFFQLMEDESARLVRLVSEVLETSMIEAGTFSYSFEDVDVGALVRAAAGTTARVRVEHGLPVVHGDPARLRQVVGNLVDNAVKYSPEGEPVDVRAYVDGDRVLVDVTDRGDGIEPGDQARIFEKFGRIANGGKPGTGLGLFISRSIAEAHGGTLDVQSSRGRGSTFTLSLPVRAHE